VDVDRPRATARPRALRELLLGGFYATPLALSAPDPLSYLRENNPANEAEESADDVARTFAARAGVLRRGRRAGAFQRNGASEADDGREHEPPSFYQDADRYPPHDRSKASRLGFGRERYGAVRVQLSASESRASIVRSAWSATRLMPRTRIGAISGPTGCGSLSRNDLTAASRSRRCSLALSALAFAGERNSVEEVAHEA